ncbi:hypothetical protein EVAR_44467_1 [Eumeta japonica]|uniref:Uncharacterized protein n=1 Tax=Eumeta variegata TaxID=151549 RepID=A0A4C1WLW9_EUMVA|nr:hypothetical protein EVAR_44467_1 [Eumeta japonica]
MATKRDTKGTSMSKSEKKQTAQIVAARAQRAAAVTKKPLIRNEISTPSGAQAPAVAEEVVALIKGAQTLSLQNTVASMVPRKPAKVEQIKQHKVVIEAGSAGRLAAVMKDTDDGTFTTLEP